LGRTPHCGPPARGLRPAADAGATAGGQPWGDADGRRGSLLDRARGGRSLRGVQRPRLRGDRRRAPAPAALRPLPRGARRLAGRRVLHDRDRAVARRRHGKPRSRGHRRGRQPVRRPAAPVSLRGPLLARRLDPRPRRGGRRAAPAQRRPRGRPPAYRPRRDGADAGLGPRRAARRRDVELELDDRLAAGSRRSAGRRAAPAARRARTWVGRGLGGSVSGA
jgi:hypothetical protein